MKSSPEEVLEKVVVDDESFSRRRFDCGAVEGLERVGGTACRSSVRRESGLD
jgi:hypothetical protein